MSDDLKAIRKRADAATPRPWSMGESLGWRSRGWGKWSINSDYPEDESNISYAVNRENDAEFIAHAREDVPRLLDLIVEQRATIARLEVERDQWKRHADTQTTAWRKENLERKRLEAELDVSQDHEDALAKVIADAPHAPGHMCSTDGTQVMDNCGCWKSRVS